MVFTRVFAVLYLEGKWVLCPSSCPEEVLGRSLAEGRRNRLLVQRWISVTLFLCTQRCLCICYGDHIGNRELDGCSGVSLCVLLPNRGTGTLASVCFPVETMLPLWKSLLYKLWCDKHMQVLPIFGASSGECYLEFRCLALDFGMGSILSFMVILLKLL